MNTSEPKRPTTLSHLPPEILGSIIDYLPTASAVACLSRTNKSLHAFTTKHAWKLFARSHFPSICPLTSPSYNDTARTLTTLSQAWDKRAFVARYVEPQHITAFPGGKQSDRWKRPQGQTIGFTPQLDVYEEIGPRWQDRSETLAFSAGAEICVRNTTRSNGGDDVRWITYRPLSACDGRNDVTALHLLRPDAIDDDGKQKLITGTANGDLQLLSLPDPDDEYDQDVRITYFATQGMPIRSSSLLQDGHHPKLLATALGDARLALYRVDPEKPKICSFSQVDIQPGLHADGRPSPAPRAWTTTFLSHSSVAVGAGPSEEPIHVYTIAESGISREGIRKLSLQTTFGQLAGANRPCSSVYSIAPLPAGAGSAGNGTVFLSGAYDGIVRLHDLRSDRDVEQMYSDAADDGAIYSVLAHGRERVVAGTSRHNLLKVFDLRLGAKCYSHLDAANQSPAHEGPVDPDRNYNVFLRPSSSQPRMMSRGVGRWRNRWVESSVYNLASSSSHSPYIYAGVRNAIVSVALTELLDPHPDPAFFHPWICSGERTGNIGSRTFKSKDVLELAMYNQSANMQLCTQRSPWETWRACQPQNGRRGSGAIDARWKSALELGP